MNPLDQLAPPIAPPPVSAWPPAPGWWLLAALLLIGIAAAFGWRWYRARRPAKAADSGIDPVRAAALVELAQLPRPAPGEPANAWLQQLNALLKRLCRSRYPADHPHTLSGRAWLAFLDNRCPAAGLTRWMVLVEGAYRAECRMDAKAIAGLQQAVEIWIRKHA